DALGEQERAASADRIGEQAAPKAEPLERGLHLINQVAPELGLALRVLAFGRDRDAARKIGEKTAVIEVTLRVGYRQFSAHGRELSSIASRPRVCRERGYRASSRI